MFPVTMDLGVAVKCFFLSCTVHMDRNTAGEEGTQGSGKGLSAPFQRWRNTRLEKPVPGSVSLSLSLFILHRIEHPVSDKGFL